MNWLVFSSIAYFIIALETILDKFLLSGKKISHPSVYAFYTGLLSAFAILFFFPFGLHKIDFIYSGYTMLAGLIFAYGFMAFFYAMRKGEASRVTTVVGAVIPVVTYLLSFLFLNDSLSGWEIPGVVLLISGGVLISVDLKHNKRHFFAGFFEAAIAGVLLAIAYTLFKRFYEGDNFINVYVWTRTGLILGALSFLIFPVWRSAILNSLAGFKKPSPEGKRTGLLFVFNKALGGIGSVILNYSFSLGNVTVINSLISIEYALVFLLGIGFTAWRPEIFAEKTDKKSLLQKISAIAIVAVGVILVSI